MAKTYYSDVVRIYNHIIRGKYIGGVWRNPCVGFLMPSSSHGSLREVYSSSTATKYNNMGVMFLPREAC